MTSPKPNIYIQQFDRTLSDQQRQETSIIVPERRSPSGQMKGERTEREGEGGRGNRGGKERYSVARTSLPKGNFDWTEYRSFEHRNTLRKEWTWRGRLVVGIGVLLIAAIITYLIIHFFINSNPKDMHEETVTPTIPTFAEMSGLMNAPKLQPLADRANPLHTARKVLHLRNQ